MSFQKLIAEISGSLAEEGDDPKAAKADRSERKSKATLHKLAWRAGVPPKERKGLVDRLHTMRQSRSKWNQHHAAKAMSDLQQRHERKLHSLVAKAGVDRRNAPTLARNMHLLSLSKETEGKYRQLVKAAKQKIKGQQGSSPQVAAKMRANKADQAQRQQKHLQAIKSHEKPRRITDPKAYMRDESVQSEARTKYQQFQGQVAMAKQNRSKVAIHDWPVNKKVKQVARKVMGLPPKMQARALAKAGSHVQSEARSKFQQRIGQLKMAEPQRSLGSIKFAAGKMGSGGATGGMDSLIMRLARSKAKRQVQAEARTKEQQYAGQVAVAKSYHTSVDPKRNALDVVKKKARFSVQNAAGGSDPLASKAASRAEPGGLQKVQTATRSGAFLNRGFGKNRPVSLPR